MDEAMAKLLNAMYNDADVTNEYGSGFSVSSFQGYLCEYLDEVFPEWITLLQERFRKSSAKVITGYDPDPDTETSQVWTATCDMHGPLPAVVDLGEEDSKLHDAALLTAWDHQRRFHGTESVYWAKLLHVPSVYMDVIKELQALPVEEDFAFKAS